MGAPRFPLLSRTLHQRARGDPLLTRVPWDLIGHLRSQQFFSNGFAWTLWNGARTDPIPPWPVPSSPGLPQARHPPGVRSSGILRILWRQRAVGRRTLPHVGQGGAAVGGHRLHGSSRRDWATGGRRHCAGRWKLRRDFLLSGVSAQGSGCPQGSGNQVRSGTLVGRQGRPLPAATGD